jgi:hypothetical protein
MFAEKSNNKEDRKTLLIPLPDNKLHLMDNLVPYCSSSYEELLEGLCSKYKSLIMKEVVAVHQHEKILIFNVHLRIERLIE